VFWEGKNHSLIINIFKFKKNSISKNTIVECPCTLCVSHKLVTKNSRVYVAMEGINAQISVPIANLEAFKTLVQSTEVLKYVQNILFHYKIVHEQFFQGRSCVRG